MSTRATYEFVTETESVVIYKHHDGYPKGAAQWLHAGDTAETFLANNEGLIEVTESHERHGDTEFKYIVSYAPFYFSNQRLKTVQAYEREIGSDKWVQFYDGLLSLFIEQYADIKPEKVLCPSITDRHNRRQMEIIQGCLERAQTPQKRFAWCLEIQRLAERILSAALESPVGLRNWTVAKVQVAELEQWRRSIEEDLDKAVDGFTPSGDIFEIKVPYINPSVEHGIKTEKLAIAWYEKGDEGNK